MPVNEIAITMPYLWWRGLALMTANTSPMIYSHIAKALTKVEYSGRDSKSDTFTVSMPEAAWSRLVSKCAASSSSAYVLVGRSLRKVIREQTGRDFVTENLIRIPLEDM